MRVFDEIIDELANEISDWLFTSSARGTPPDGVRVGRDPETRSTASITFKAKSMTTSARCDQLRAARRARGDNPSVRLWHQYSARRSTYRALVAGALAAEHRPARSHATSTGQATNTPAIASAVASVTGIAAAQAAGAVQPLPALFVEEVDHPRWREVWRERAKRTGGREADARLTVSYEMFARAARQTGAYEPDWRARLAQFRVLEGPSGAS